MKFNFFKKTQAAATEPAGATALTVAPTTVAVSTSAPEPSGNNTEINKNDMFEEIKSKFLNEIDKIPRKSVSSETEILSSLKEATASTHHCVESDSTSVGSDCHRCGGGTADAYLLLLHNQKVLLQEEEEQEGQKGQGRLQHEEHGGR